MIACPPVAIDSCRVQWIGVYYSRYKWCKRILGTVIPDHATDYPMAQPIDNSKIQTCL